MREFVACPAHVGVGKVFLDCSNGDCASLAPRNLQYAIDVEFCISVETVVLQFQTLRGPGGLVIASSAPTHVRCIRFSGSTCDWISAV